VITEIRKPNSAPTLEAVNNEADVLDDDLIAA
jgi:hypothetical protein